MKELLSALTEEDLKRLPTLIIRVMDDKGYRSRTFSERLSQDFFRKVEETTNTSYIQDGVAYLTRRDYAIWLKHWSQTNIQDERKDY